MQDFRLRLFDAYTCLKYQALPDAVSILGSADKILSTFINFQKHLYQRTEAA
ncbi:MAG: hypothetical protein HGA99_05630 [Chlorobiaceae bacterium]|nr:hypothetical protein [Chlorobiaceae bacterium]